MGWKEHGTRLELGKKSDERPSSSTEWTARKVASGLPRRRRTIYVICSLFAVFLIAKNLSLFPLEASSDVSEPSLPLSHVGQTEKPRDMPRPGRSYSGPIKFYRLAASLQSVAHLRGQRRFNRNVLFAAAGSKSLAAVVPIACGMAQRDRNDVHVALLGQDETSLGELQSIHGATDCGVHWHDGRPDHAVESTYARMQTSAAAALAHLYEFLHPQVLIVDSPLREESYSTKASRQQQAVPVIELPEDAVETLMWITQLDSAALSAWTKVSVDIVVQAPNEHAASTVRLLRSIEEADYFGARRPSLTVELPTAVNSQVEEYLQNMIWPPQSESPPTSRLTVRRRIRRKTASPEEASARLVESFYPRSAENSHLLFLSSECELAPLYYHYLFYSLLDLRYSEPGGLPPNSELIAGISLDLPQKYLNGTFPFVMPKTNTTTRSPFLWQAPSNRAVLYFGETWKEFNSFLSKRLATKPTLRSRLMDDKKPMWLDFLLELMKARAWTLFQPGNLNEQVALVTIHEEDYEIPDELLRKPGRDVAASPQLQERDVLTDEKLRRPEDAERALLTSSLLSVMSNTSKDDSLPDLAILDFDGNDVSAADIASSARNFAKEFRQTIGRCKEANLAPYEQITASILFCNDAEQYDHYIEEQQMDTRLVEDIEPDDKDSPQVPFKVDSSDPLEQRLGVGDFRKSAPTLAANSSSSRKDDRARSATSASESSATTKMAETVENDIPSKETSGQDTVGALSGRSPGW